MVGFDFFQRVLFLFVECMDAVSFIMVMVLSTVLNHKMCSEKLVIFLKAVTYFWKYYFMIFCSFPGDTVTPTVNVQQQNTTISTSSLNMAADKIEAVVCNVDDLKSGEYVWFFFIIY